MKSALFAAAAICLVVSACYAPPPKAPRPAVRESDHQAWANAPLVDLETHPVWSLMTPEKKPLSDGSEMWTYEACKERHHDAQCKTLLMPGQYVTAARTRCEEERTERKNCCYNQFIVSDGRVKSYRQLGATCYSTCKLRPASAPCDETGGSVAVN